MIVHERHVKRDAGATTSSTPAEVLTKAVLRVAERLDMKQGELAEVLHLSTATLSRIARGHQTLQPSNFEIAALFVRVFRSLDALLGSNAEHIKAWFYAYNNHLGAVPFEAVKTTQGLVHTVEYLDAMRAKI